MKPLFFISLPLLFLLACKSHIRNVTDETFCGHSVVLDGQGKLLPWFSPADRAYDEFLRKRWDFIKYKVPFSPGPAPRSSYPQYYFYCAFKDKKGTLEPDAWMNDVGEKIPNWFENARLYYAYTGDESVMKIVKDLIDYTIVHGTSPDSFAWPGMPFTTTNAGDTLFRGFTSAGRLALHEIQVDHAAEMGLTYYRMYLYSADKKYLEASLKVADILAAESKDGNGTNSVLPYRVVLSDGSVTAPYGANWAGCYMLFDNLIRDNTGNVEVYKIARERIKAFLNSYPVKTGYWTDGHSDTDVKSNTYKSNLSASNMTLCLFDYPGLNEEYRKVIPDLIKWTEDNFVFRTAPGEPSTMWGANIVGEQDTFNFKMDYQTARYAAACARWYAVTGDESFREKAFRSINWVTYCSDSAGLAFESPVSKGINSWWSDCYGECPRMFYHVFSALPELAPVNEDHILYSEAILRDVSYSENKVSFTTASGNSIIYLKLSFRPESITLNGMKLKKSIKELPGTYYIESLGKGDFKMTVRPGAAGKTVISG